MVVSILNIIPNAKALSSLTLAVFSLTACAAPTETTRSTITVDGKQYPLRTITENGPNGPFQQSSVKVRNQYYLCLPDSPGDCEAAIKIAIDQRPGGN